MLGTIESAQSMPETNLSRITFLIALGIYLFAAQHILASDPATRPLYNPAATQPAPLDPSAALLMQALGDPNFVVRSQAGDQLLAMGTRALIALGRAARSEDPEVRARARALLRRMHWDEPADPPPVSAEMTHFGEFDIPKRRQIVRELAGMQGPDSAAAWKALGRILQNDPADDVLWEAVAQLRMHPDRHVGLGRQSEQWVTGPMRAVAGRIYLHRDPAIAARLLLAALAADKSADPPVRDRSEILFVVNDLLKLARSTHQEAEGAQLIRDQYMLAAVHQRSWLNRELYALHASAGPLAGFADDLKFRPPNLADRPTLYGLAWMLQRFGHAQSARWAEDVAFYAGRQTAQTQPAAAISSQLESRVDESDFLLEHDWFDYAQREMDEVLRIAPADDTYHRISAYFHLIRIATARGDDFGYAECLRKSLELMEKYPNPAIRLSYQSARLLPDDRQNLRASMHWFYFRAARKKNNSRDELEHAIELARLKPIHDDLLLEVYPFLTESGHAADAQQLFDANYISMRAQIAQIGPEPGGLIRLARICARCNQHLEEARQLAADALAQEPKNAKWVGILADVEHRLGHDEEAIRLQTRAVQLDPKDVELQSNLSLYRRNESSATRP